MDVLYTCCCGLDVHKKSVIACLRSFKGDRVQQQTRRFGTMTRDLLALSDWLLQAGCTHVAMESTGVFWRPIYNLLEDQFKLLVVNAHHLKAVPGRKTDQKDAEWIAELLQHGLLRASFIPPVAQRQQRDLTRYRRTLVEDRVRIINRLQKVLEDANIKLSAVVSDLLGVSARDMLDRLASGETDPELLAQLARGRLRSKLAQLQAALEGHFTAHHAFLVAEYLNHIDYLSISIDRVEAQIDQHLAGYEQDINLLDTIPGVNRRTAQIMLAEMGRDMSRFTSARHLASWAGICPGNHESAGKRFSGRTRHGNHYLKQVLMEAAHGASRTHHTYLKAQYLRLSARRGRKRAIVAVAHSILVIAYYVLKRREAYRELGGNYFDERDKQVVQRRLVQRLEQLGYAVSLQAASA
jgi:transposase